MRRLTLALALLSIAGSGLLVAQSVRFKSDVDLVALDVCVRTRNGHPAAGLKREDFLILENNVTQKIALFGPGGHIPSAVALLVDNSHSMAGAPLERAQIAATRFIETLSPNDLVEVISFNNDITVRYPLGSDHQQAKRSLNDMAATGATRLYETLLVALRRIDRVKRNRSVEYRDVIILLSDGADTKSALLFDDVLEDTRRSGALVYTISLRADDQVAAPRWEMALLAHDTGGRAFGVRDLAGLTRIYQEIGADLADLYRVGYVPSSLVRDGQWRSISVRVPGTNLVARTRSGYYAPRARSRTPHSPTR